MRYKPHLSYKLLHEISDSYTKYICSLPEQPAGSLKMKINENKAILTLMTDTFSTSVTINTQPEILWAALTEPSLMVAWMGVPEMQLRIQTSWEINMPIVITGFHHTEFECKGLVLQYDKYKKLSYSQLSSVSRLPDEPANYTIIEFTLVPVEGQTLLSLIITNFPTETIRKHLEFYWRTTIIVIKKNIEGL